MSLSCTSRRDTPQKATASRQDGQDDWDPLLAIAPDGGRVFPIGTTAMVTLAYDTDELAD